MEVDFVKIWKETKANLFSKNYLVHKILDTNWSIFRLVTLKVLRISMENATKFSNYNYNE